MIREYALRDLIAASDSGEWGVDPEGAESVGVLRAGNLCNDGTLDLSDLAFRAIPDRKRAKLRLRAGDIVLERSGGSDNRPVGRVAYIANDTELAFTNFLHRLRANTALIEPEYLFYLLLNLHHEGRTNALQTQTTGIRNLMFDRYLSQVFRVPPVSDQRRVLLFLRAAASCLERLRDVISAKHAFKRALLHELLTGRLRFPEFTDNSWMAVSLGDLLTSSSYRGHQVPSTKFASVGRWPVIDQGDKRIAGYTDAVEPITAPLPVVVFGDHTRTVKFADAPFVVGADGVKLLTAANGECTPRYLYWLLQLSVERLPNLGYSRHFSMLREVEVPFCRSEPERERIVAVLDLVEREIEALEALTDRYEAQKRALMHRLVSGDLPLPAPASTPELAHA